MPFADEIARITHWTDVSIRRALGFAMIAMLSIGAGLSFDPPMALKSSALEAMLAAAILIYKAIPAPTRDYRRTEVWMLLDKTHHLPETRAQAVIGTILRERYLKHAEYAAIVACTCWAASFALQALRRVVWV